MIRQCFFKNIQSAGRNNIPLLCIFDTGSVARAKALLDKNLRAIHQFSDEVAKGTQPTYNAANKSWTSPAGLVYELGSEQGNRVQHVLTHTVADPSKPVHTVFNVERNKILGLVDEAWTQRVGTGALQGNGNRYGLLIWAVQSELQEKPP